MKAQQILPAALAVSSALAGAIEPARVEARATKTGSSTLPTVTVKGKAFWAGSERFYIRGVDYQPGGSSEATDPLANSATCMRDIPYFKKMGLNTIRVYTVDNSADHDDCMTALAEAGIYLALDVNTPQYSINRDSPGESYNPTYLQSVFATIDAFQKYSNTLLFFSGNEVINLANNTNTAPYVKAVNRDMKQYIGERGYRDIPVGYSAADVSENQFLMAQYMSCGESQTQGDFYAINNYEWCEPSSYTQSGWNALAAMYKNYSQPVFMSEYGCITNGRNFQETKALYQTDMTDVFSGGLVYEYSQEGNHFGLVTISGSSVTPVGQQVQDLTNALSSTPNPSGDGALVAGGEAQSCPAQGVNWDTKPWIGSALPATPEGATKYFKEGAGKGPGLSGPGSQDAPGGSTATASAGAGDVTATYGASSATGSSAANALRFGPADMAPLACGAIMLVAMGFGAALL